MTIGWYSPCYSTHPLPVADTNSPLPFERADLELLTVEDLSAQLRVSRAFVRRCLDCGCPTRRGRLSAAELLEWLFANYATVRATCGLPVLPGFDGVTAGAARRLQLGNAVITLLEFSESRATESEVKRELRRVRLGVEQALDRG